MSHRAAPDPSGGVTAGRCGVSPAALAVAAVKSAARVAGAVADAVLVVDDVEAARRIRFGLRGVSDLGLLDALMCLPVGAPVAVDDLSPVSRSRLRAAPAGCVEWLAGGTRVRRLLTPALTVDLVVVRAGTWRAGLLRAAAFEPFATRVVLLPCEPRTLRDIAWQADAAGIGLWIGQADEDRPMDTPAAEAGTGEVVQVVGPAPFVRRYVKPAGWRFTERAYTTWTATRANTTRERGVGAAGAGTAGGGVTGISASRR